jgi:hypothetical protein
MRIELVDKNGVIVMNKGLNDLINCIAKKKRFVVKVNFDEHRDKDTRLQEARTMYKVQGRTSISDFEALSLEPSALSSPHDK